MSKSKAPIVCSAAGQWKLQRYARYVNDNSKTGETTADWQYFDSEKEELSLTVTDSSQLIVNQGNTILESHSLSHCRNWMRGVAKGDSLLLMYKLKAQTRRFRVKFNSDASPQMPAVQSCENCINELSKFFPVRIAPVVCDDPPSHGKQESEQTRGESTADTKENVPKKLTGEVTLGEVAQIVMGTLNAELPQAYQQCDVSPEYLDTYVRLCLTDPNFPAFVGQVEKALQNVVQESSSL